MSGNCDCFFLSLRCQSDLRCHRIDLFFFFLIGSPLLLSTPGGFQFSGKEMVKSESYDLHIFVDYNVFYWFFGAVEQSKGCAGGRMTKCLVNLSISGWFGHLKGIWGILFNKGVFRSFSNIKWSFHNPSGGKNDPFINGRGDELLNLIFDIPHSLRGGQPVSQPHKVPAMAFALWERFQLGIKYWPQN